MPSHDHAADHTSSDTTAHTVVGDDGAVAFVDATGHDAPGAAAMLDELAATLEPGAVVSVHVDDEAAAEALGRWCRDRAGLELVTTVRTDHGPTIAIRIR